MTLEDEIRDLLKTIETKFGELQRAVSGALSAVGSWAAVVADQIQDAWTKICTEAEKFWNAIGEILGNMGDPGALSDMSTRWNADVGAPVSAKVQVADAGNLEVDETWSGKAADNYRQRISLHKTALDKVQSTIAVGMSSALDTVKTGIWTFFGCLLGALASLVVGILGALASTATILGIPAGILIGAGAFLVAAAAVFTGGILLKSSCQSALNALQQKVGDNSGFLDGRWPKGALA
ncbi:hypothetical protein [Pengzhenrongella sp.]|jgi:hypothetical protein|uniref:hypothetical protein n=1 Tax=Pengzhenrongella sp. TaxID=2888820 RepID=UPI002F953126